MITFILRGAAALGFTVTGAAAALVGVMATGVASTAAAHGTHYDCKMHGFRTYSHRHVGADAAVVECAPTVVDGGRATVAVCEAVARRNGGAGPIVNGTLANITLPLRPSDSMAARAEALNIACEDARAECLQAAFSIGARGAACQVINQRLAY